MTAEAGAAVVQPGPLGRDGRPSTSQPSTSQPGTSQPHASQPGASQPSAPDPRAAAVAAGLPDVGDAEVLEIGSSHHVRRVVAGSGSVIVKSPSERAQRNGRTLAAEAYAYRLASWRPGLADCLPRALLVDERRQVIVLESVPEAQTGAALLDRGAIPDPSISASLGRSLARVHASTWGLPAPCAASSGVLDIPDSSAEGIGLERALPLALTVRHNPDLAAVLRRGRQLWRQLCLVHGDVKWANCLVMLPASGPPKVRLIDWELSGSGEPMWDLAAALAGSTALELETGHPGDRDRAGVVRGYAESGGTIYTEHLAAYWPARLIHLALECAEAGAGAQAEALVASAAQLARDRNDLEGMIRSWASTLPTDSHAGSTAI